ncbi:MAG: hypothetical protein L0Z07_01235 [Planctomycetes bacterium]|nr:hypothetical protein [Planctomycetota bacterium]
MTARFICCALAFVLCGCHMPWSIENGGSVARNEPLRPEMERTTSEPVVSVTTVGKLKTTGLPDPVPVPAATTTAVKASAPQANAGQDFAGVLVELRQVGEIDPVAQQQLIKELEHTKPELWPLAIQQFRATLAYHEQLTGTRQQPNREVDASAKAVIQASASSTSISAFSDRQAANTTRPSTAIGALVDPRGAQRVPSDSLADGVVNQPAPGGVSRDQAPAEFKGKELAQPMAVAEAGGNTSTAAQPTVADRLQAPLQGVVQIRFDEADDSPWNESTTLDSVEGESGAAFVPPAGAAAATAGQDWHELIEMAADRLASQAPPSPQSTAEVHQHATLRILRLLAGRTEESLEPIPRISPVEQDYWSRQLFALATYLDHHQQPDEERRAAASAAHLDEAVASLRELGALSLRNLAFCKEVQGYGAYEPYDTDRFSSGEQVSLYVEIENYCSQSTEMGYSTQLGATYEILNEKGRNVDGGKFPDVEDCCRSRRRDFHVRYGLTLPEKLASGKYRLQLVVKDRKSDKKGSAQLAFEVDSAGK